MDLKSEYFPISYPRGLARPGSTLKFHTRLQDDHFLQKGHGPWPRARTVLKGLAGKTFEVQSNIEHVAVEPEGIKL